MNLSMLIHQLITQNHQKELFVMKTPSHKISYSYVVAAIDLKKIN